MFNHKAWIDSAVNSEIQNSLADDAKAVTVEEITFAEWARAWVNFMGDK